MHELSIAVGIVEAVVSEAEARGLGDITTVHLTLGTLSGVDRDALLFSFPLACEGTTAEGARLVIEELPVMIACGGCGQQTQPPSITNLICPRCGPREYEIVQGTEIELRAFEAAEGALA